MDTIHREINVNHTIPTSSESEGGLGVVSEGEARMEAKSMTTGWMGVAWREVMREVL